MIIFGHMEDPDLSDPVRITWGGAYIYIVFVMGFMLNVEDVGWCDERAVERLFSHPHGTDGGNPLVVATPLQPRGSSTFPVKYKLETFISHKGPRMHTGHYVTHIRGGGDEEDGVLVCFYEVVDIRLRRCIT